MDIVVANELEIVGSHGMQAHRYDAMLAMIVAGTLSPRKHIGRTIDLEQSINALTTLDGSAEPGVTVVGTQMNAANIVYTNVKRQNDQIQT